MLGHHIGPAPTNKELGITLQTHQSMAKPFQVYEDGGSYWFYAVHVDPLQKITFGPYDERGAAEWAAAEAEAVW